MASSRKTGYKWWKRYESGGLTALADRSRARHQQAHAVPEQMAQAILRGTRGSPSLGPRKTEGLATTQTTRPGLAFGEHDRRDPETCWTYCQTRQAAVGRSDAGPLTAGRSRQCRLVCRLQRIFSLPGWKPLRPLDGHRRLQPLLLRCQAVDGLDEKYVRALLEAAFREYGLPNTIRTDNGSPFASVALAGLSALSVWWIKLGIWPERIAPGKPQQNGRHERMHRTLREATAQPPSRTLGLQQRAFDKFREEYNHERPHQALEMKTPGEFYQPSGRCYPQRVKTPEYNSGLLVRGVGECGRIRWSGERIFITKTLGHEPIGLQGIDDGIWKIWFGNYPVGWINERTMQATDLDQPPKLPQSPKAQTKPNLPKKETLNRPSGPPPESLTEKEKTS